MNITLNEIKHCLYRDNAYGPAVIENCTMPSNLQFYRLIFPPLLLDTDNKHHLYSKWSNKTTLSYIMNHKDTKNGMKEYNHQMHNLLSQSSAISDLINHCTQYLQSQSSFSADRFYTVFTKFAEDFSPVPDSLTQPVQILARINPGAVLAIAIIHAVLYRDQAYECVCSYLDTPEGQRLLVTCNIPDSSHTEYQVQPSDLSDLKPASSDVQRENDNCWHFVNSYRLMDPIPTFVGRNAYISQIMALLHNTNEVHHLFIFGMSGIGKTELVKKYAASYRNFYHNIQMVSYRNSLKETLCFNLPIANFDDSFAGNGEADLQNCFTKKLEVLRQIMDSKSLLIIDNMNRSDDPDLAQLLNCGFSVIFTSTFDFSGRGYQTMKVHALESDYESLPSAHKGLSPDSMTPSNLSDFEERGLTLRFFQMIYGKKLSENELKIIHDLLMDFDGHTLITELLAKQMKSSFMDAAGLSSLLREKGILGTTQIERVSHYSSSTPKTVYDYISRMVSTESLTAEECGLLKQLAIFPISGIDIRLFKKLCSLSTYETLWDLSNKSLITINTENNIVYLHPLIHELIETNLFPSPEDYTVVLQNFSELLKDSWSKPADSTNVYQEYVLSVLKKIQTYSSENLALYEPLLEYAWQCGHFEFVIRLGNHLHDFALANQYPPSVIGSLCRAIGNSLYSAGLLFRQESTFWFQRMLDAYKNAGDAFRKETAFAIKSLARAGLNQVISDFSLKILLPETDSNNCNDTGNAYRIYQKFDYPELIRERNERLEELFSQTEFALFLLKQQMQDSSDTEVQNHCLSYMGDIHFIRCCIGIYLEKNLDLLIKEINIAINECYKLGSSLRSLSITSALNLKAKLLMLSGDITSSERLLHDAMKIETAYRGNSDNPHIIRILISLGDLALFRKMPGNARLSYRKANDIIYQYKYLDRGRFFEEVSEKLNHTDNGIYTQNIQFYITTGI